MKEMVCGYPCVVITQALVRIFLVTFAIEFHIEIQILIDMGLLGPAWCKLFSVILLHFLLYIFRM